MAPTIQRRLSDGQEGTVTIAVLVSLGAAVIVALSVVVILVVLRRRQDRSEDIPYGVPRPIRTHKPTVSETSMNPLLNGEWDRTEKLILPKRQFSDEDRDTLSDNPNGLYRIPSSHAHLPHPSTPTPSSYCLPQGLDANTVSDHGAHTVANERLSIPPLPPLVIPSYPRHLQTQRPAAAEEESSPTQPLSKSSSTSSLYSQPTAEAAPTKPGYFEIPLSQEFAYGPHTSEEDVHRGETQFVGTLLKARAQRNPNGLMREGSQISHIERSGSIKSVSSIHHDNRPYSKRYRSQKRKATQVGEMEAVKEVSEAGSLRSPTESQAHAHWERGYLVQVPPRIAVSRFPQLERAY